MSLNKNSFDIPPHIKKFLLFGKNETYTLKDEDGLPLIVNGKELKISTIDVGDLNGFTDEDIVFIVNKKLDIDITTDEGLNKINELFQKSIDIIHLSRIKVILEKKKVKLDEFDFPFTNYKDLIAFLKLSGDKNNGWTGKSACLISKIVLSIDSILNSPGLSNLEENEAKFYQKFKQGFNIREFGEISEGYFRGKKFVFHGRPKSLISCVLKGIKDVDCINISRLTDGIQYTFEYDGNKKEIVDLLKQIYNIITGLGGQFEKGSIKEYNKKDFLDTYGVEDEFYKNVLESLKTSKKGTSSKGYKDVKLVFYINGTPIEVKVTTKGNKNQDGINFHGVYEYLNKYTEGIVIRGINNGYIDDELIDTLVVDFFERLTLLIRDNLEKRGCCEEGYLKELWYDLQKDGFIRRNVKFENQIKNKDKIIKLYFIPGLKKYFISKLIKLTPEEEGIYTNERTQKIAEYFEL